MPRREKGRAWLFLNGLKVPNRGVFCRITGQALQSSLMVAFFAAVLSEGSGVESYVVAPSRCRDAVSQKMARICRWSPLVEELACKAATDKLLDVLEGRPTTIDGVIAFAEGPAKQLMGEEAAAAMLAEQLKRKEAGAKYCNCPSCTAASELLAKFGRIEL